MNNIFKKNSVFLLIIYEFYNRSFVGKFIVLGICL